jgi:hypothetical protein
MKYAWLGIAAPAAAMLYVLGTGRLIEGSSPKVGRPFALTRNTQALLPMRASLAPPARDPFNASENPPQNPPQPHTTSAAPVQPVQEAPPALNLRFDGRMISPSGIPMIFASFGDTPIVLSVGRGLPNGYVVKSITDRVVEFDYPPLGTSARLDLPPEPRAGIR